MTNRNFDEWLSKFRPSISSYDYYIDFAKVVNALKKIDYKDDLTLEASSYLSSRGYADRESVFNGVKELYASVKKLKKM